MQDSIKDHAGRPIRLYDHVGQLNISDQARGASPVNAGRIGRVIDIPANARTRVVVQFPSDDNPRTIATEHLMVMRYLNEAWTSDFDPTAEYDKGDRQAADEADVRGGFFGNAIGAALRRTEDEVRKARPATGVIVHRPTGREVRPVADDIDFHAPKDTAEEAVLHVGDVRIVFDPSSRESRMDAIATLARIQHAAAKLEASLRVIYLAPELRTGE